MKIIQLANEFHAILEDTALPKSVVHYIAKYIMQKCITDVWVIHMIETKPTLMTHTVLPKMRFLMTFIQINNTVYNLLG